VDGTVVVLIAVSTPLLCWRISKGRRLLPWLPVGGAFVYAVTAYIAMKNTSDADWASAVALIASLVGYLVCMLFVFIAVTPSVRNRSKQ
jgi:hypothetical protein